jgi:hypothetical protein
VYGVVGHGRQIDHDMRLVDLLHNRLIEAGWQLTNDTPRTQADDSRS